MPISHVSQTPLEYAKQDDMFLPLVPHLKLLKYASSLPIACNPWFIHPIADMLQG